MLSRRSVMMGALAAPASFCFVAKAQNPPASGPGGNAVPRTILELQRRNIVVNGKSASVYGIRQPDGTDGITTDVGKPFSVRVVNKINEPSLIHWHGMTPPWQQDGVPGVSGPAIPPGGSADYDYPLRFGGTFWMHSHQGLQEQLLMAAPLIIRDQRDRPGQQEIVLIGVDEDHQGEAMGEGNRGDTAAGSSADDRGGAGAYEHQREGADELRKELGCN